MSTSSKVQFSATSCSFQPPPKDVGCCKDNDLSARAKEACREGTMMVVGSDLHKHHEVQTDLLNAIDKKRDYWWGMVYACPAPEPATILGWSRRCRTVLHRAKSPFLEFYPPYLGPLSRLIPTRHFDQRVLLWLQNVFKGLQVLTLEDYMVGRLDPTTIFLVDGDKDHPDPRCLMTNVSTLLHEEFASSNLSLLDREELRKFLPPPEYIPISMLSAEAAGKCDLAGKTLHQVHTDLLKRVNDYVRAYNDSIPASVSPRKNNSIDIPLFYAWLRKGVAGVSATRLRLNYNTFAMGMVLMKVLKGSSLKAENRGVYDDLLDLATHMTEFSDMRRPSIHDAAKVYHEILERHAIDMADPEEAIIFLRHKDSPRHPLKHLTPRHRRKKDDKSPVKHKVKEEKERQRSPPKKKRKTKETRKSPDKKSPSNEFLLEDWD